MKNKPTTTLYELYKDTPKKLKIICDWDEVIQATEPYAAYLETILRENKTMEKLDFTQYFRLFWNTLAVEYSSYGSKLASYSEEMNKKQIQIKNSPDFYQQTPFLTIAEDLLKLIKEGKVERLIFLSAYDKRKFPHRDPRKAGIFNQTFDKVGYYRTELDKEKGIKSLPCYLELVGFDSETQGQSKADWIKANASDYDIVIDDNPLICQSLVGEILVKHQKEARVVEKKEIRVISPYYPAIENQHFMGVLLVKQEVVKIEKWEK